MPIFVSYSHGDKRFVDKLALNLVVHKVHVWLDRWEIHAGESLVDKVQEAITGASALLVVFSKNSVESSWCKKELNAGLVRELEEKRVLIVPVMKEKVTLPPFLKEKLYADFTKDFDDGLQTVLASIASVTNDKLGRLEDPKWHTDWAIDWGTIDGRDIFRLMMVETSEDQPYVVLGQVMLVPDNDVMDWYREHVKNGTDRLARRDIVVALARSVGPLIDMNVRLDDEREITLYAPVLMEQGKVMATIQVRRLGKDTGRTILFRLGQQIVGIGQSIIELTAGEEEMAKNAAKAAAKKRRSTKRKSPKLTSKPKRKSEKTSKLKKAAKKKSSKRR